MLIGNVGKEPEVRYVDQGQPVARLSLATTERGYTLQNGTQVPDRTEWHSVILWRKLAEVVEHYVHKGDKLYIEGRIHYASYDGDLGRQHGNALTASCRSARNFASCTAVNRYFYVGR